MTDILKVAIVGHPFLTDVVSEESTPCDKCGTLLYVGMWPFCKGDPSSHGKSSLYTEKTFPFITKNFTGQPIEVTSRAHEKALMQEHGVTKRDDIAWNEKSYEGYNPKTGKQEYKEANGVGMPGCWI
jgi:hypothetical protein